MSVLHWPLQNALLGALPDAVMQRLRPDLKRMQMPAGLVLCEPGLPVHDVYFPESCVIAMGVAMGSGNSAEVAVIGREGMVGVRLLLGATSMTVRASVLSAGWGFRLPVGRLVEEFSRGGALMQALLHYTEAYIAQIVQTAACNRFGTVEERHRRWLLLCLERMAGNRLTMTHERIAEALGVKREGVSEVAGRLRRRGAIRYQRGQIEVLDRSILEERACECYRSDKEAPDRGNRI